MNTDESDLVLLRAETRVLGIQTKLHRWARDDPDRRFDDLFNLVADPQGSVTSKVCPVLGVGGVAAGWRWG